MQVDRLLPKHDDELVAFLDDLGADSPSVLGYHYPMYRDMLAHLGIGEPFGLGAWSSGHLVGFLPGLIAHSEIGSVYSSLPFFGPNAGVLCGSAGSELIHHSLLGSVREVMRSFPRPLSASFYTPFLGNALDSYDMALDRPLIVERFTQYQRLDADGHRRRDEVRKAERAGVEVLPVTGSDRDELYRLYARSCEERGIPAKPLAAFEWLLDRGGERVGSFVARQNGRLTAGLIVLHGPGTVSYYMPAIDDGAKRSGTSAKLIDHALNDARRRGRRYWNWESSPARGDGVYAYKRRWGGVEGAYRIYVELFMPEAEILNQGAAALQRAFPHFFVYPFDRIRKAAGDGASNSSSISE